MSDENSAETLWNEVGYFAVKYATMGTDCKKENVKKLGIDAINNFAEQIKEDAEAKNKALEERVAELEEEVERLGDMSNICTYSSTKKVCSTCKCPRLNKTKEG